VNPKFIPTFDVALAHDAAKVKGVDIFDGTWFVSRKLDGVRCICFVHGDDIRFFSRNGKEFLTLGKVAEEIRRLGITDLVLDGELCLMNEDGSDDFQGILKQIQRKDHTIENPKYQIFDILQAGEFAGDDESPLFSTRIDCRENWLGDLKSSTILEMLPQVRIKDEDSLDDSDVEALLEDLEEDESIEDDDDDIYDGLETRKTSSNDRKQRTGWRSTVSLEFLHNMVRLASSSASKAEYDIGFDLLRAKLRDTRKINGNVQFRSADLKEMLRTGELRPDLLAALGVTLN
jgi:hypothetical protein